MRIVSLGHAVAGVGKPGGWLQNRFGRMVRVAAAVRRQTVPDHARGLLRAKEVLHVV